MDSPFYLWSISEAWNWLIDVPFIGFFFLILFFAGFVTLVFKTIIVIAGAFIWLSDEGKKQ